MMSRPTLRLKSWSVPPSSTSAFEVDRVVRLRQRIEELVDRNRLAGLVPLLEVAPLEHLRHVVARSEPDQPVGAERAQPAGIEVDHGLVAIEDREDLRFVGLGVGRDFIDRQRRTRLGSAGRIANHSREVADDEDDAMPEILKVLHLANEHGVTEVQVRSGRVETHLHRQRRGCGHRALEFGAQLCPRERCPRTPSSGRQTGHRRSSDTYRTGNDRGGHLTSA